MTILVLGATGMVGSHVARELHDRGEPVRAYVRDPGKAAGMLGPTLPLAVGELGDRAASAAALVGVDRVLLCLANRPDQAELEMATIDACQAAGVRRIVKISAKGAEIGSPVPFWDQHARIEEHLRRSGIPAVVLRPSTYATVLFGAAASVGAVGRIFAPAGHAPIAFVDPRDVAAVAVAALLDPRHQGRTYTVTGPQALTFAEVAQRWTAAAGRPVEYVDVPEDAARAAMVESGMPPWLADGIVAVFGQLRRGAAAAVTDQVKAILGHPPRPLDDFLQTFLVTHPVPARR